MKEALSFSETFLQEPHGKTSQKTPFFEDLIIIIIIIIIILLSQLPRPIICLHFEGVRGSALLWPGNQGFSCRAVFTGFASVDVGPHRAERTLLRNVL
jgi:hypothetical protein